MISVRTVRAGISMGISYVKAQQREVLRDLLDYTFLSFKLVGRNEVDALSQGQALRAQDIRLLAPYPSPSVLTSLISASFIFYTVSGVVTTYRPTECSFLPVIFWSG